MSEYPVCNPGKQVIISIGDKAFIKQMRLGENWQPEPIEVEGVVTGFDKHSFTVLYDGQYRVFPFHALGEFVRVIITQPVAKHDGSLDTRTYQSDRCHATVWIEEDTRLYDSKLIVVYGGYGDCENNQIFLDPKQALSLLSWLQQEHEALERLV